MNLFSESLKRHISEYYLLYLFEYALVFPLWLNLLPSFVFKHIYTAPFLLYFNLTSLLIVLAGCLKNRRPASRIPDRAILLVAVVLHLAILITLLLAAVSFRDFALPLIFSSAISIWWIVIYFTDSPAASLKNNKDIGRKIIKYYVLCALLLYVPFMLLGKYFKGKINLIAGQDSAEFFKDLNYKQLEKMLDQTMLQYIGTAFLLAAIVTILFLYFFKRVKNELAR